jgi:hypothetical protein
MSERPPRTRHGMVGWYDPARLIQTGVDIALSTILARRADYRLLEALTPDQPRFDYSTKKEIGIDYVADVGDGWHSTYAIAHLLAQPEIALAPSAGKGEELVLPRGDILVMGGDQVYPVASRKAYEERFLAPYEKAFPPTGSEAEGSAPELFAIPGNHDWYDGLVAFTRQFCTGGKRSIGGWRAVQTRSYFAIRLPHRFWLFAVDIQLEADIDDRQLEYFREVMRSSDPARPGMQNGDRVILCTAEPDWVLAAHYDEPDYLKNVLAFERDIEEHGGTIVARIAGDLHHYRRHESKRRGVQYITAGGGGAFLHPTYPRRPKIEAVGETLSEKTAYPTAQESWWLGFRNLAFPLYNPRFGLATAVVYAVLSATLPAPEAADIHDVFTDALKHMAMRPSAVVIVALILAGFYAFTDTHVKAYRVLGALLHGSAHLSAALVLTWLVRDRLQCVLATEALLNPSALAIVAVLGYVAGALLMGLYLWISFCFFGRHCNEAFSSLRIDGFKSFLRMRIDREGMLTIHAVKLERIPVRKPWWRPRRPSDESRSSTSFDARTAVAVAVAAALALPSLACHHAHVAAIRRDATGREDLVEGAPQYQERDVSWYFWGFSQPDDEHPSCNRNGLAEVETKMNVFVSVLTLGIWTPGTLRWKCATDPQAGTDFLRRLPCAAPPPPAAPPTPLPDGGGR